MSDLAIVILSGGLDSTVLLHRLKSQGHDIHALLFDYGQRHRKELACAKYSCEQLGASWDIVDLTNLTHLISNSALTSQGKYDPTDPTDEIAAAIEVPEGHYAEDNMKQTVVPNRNMIMLSIAAGVAVNEGAAFVATGVHAGDHFVYPDCREQFINSCAQTVQLANEGFSKFAFGGPIYAPFLYWSKADIAHEGMQLGVDFSKTWSCYKGGDVHCGKCGTCVERLEAIVEAQGRLTAEQQANGVGYDHTEYEDTEYWKLAVAAAK